MKIAFFLPDLYGGGAERVVVLLANALAKKHTVYLILVRKSGDLFSLVDKKVNLIVLNKKSVYKSFFALYKKLKKIKPDIVISALDTANLISLFVSKLLEIKHISTIHDYFSKKYSIFMRIILKLLKFSDKVVSVSKGVQKDLEKFGIKSVVIYNPVISSLKKSKKENVIVSIGRLESVKDFKTLIDAFNMLNLKDYKLYILGKGSLENELKSYANNENIIFPGFVDVNKYLSKAKLLVNSSLSETFGLVIVEALSYCVNVVATKTDGAKEILENGKYGFLVPIKNPKKLAETIKFALDNPKECELLHKRAKDFTIDKVVKEYENLIKEVINDNSD